MILNTSKDIVSKHVRSAIIICAYICWIYKPNALAQDKLYPLFQNSVLQDLNQPPHKTSSQHFKTVHPLTLPFFDDFSRYTGYPNDSLWLDNYVYINTGMGVNPPSTGVATFDGLNSYGLAYDPGSAAGHLPSDTLTSNYIDLSSYKDKDSVYLSFYYQPQGLGEGPNPEDSLILEFKPDSVPVPYDTSSNPKGWNKNIWIETWSIGGGNPVSPFKQVMIPIRTIKNANLFQNNFQFRFRNICNHSGNLDIWNVDYVYLNKGRSKKDTAEEDVTVYEPSNSLLKRYTSIPWRHFVADTTDYNIDSIHIYTHHIDTTGPSFVNFNYQIKSLSDNFTTINSPSPPPVNNVNQNEFQDYTIRANHIKNFTPKNPDSVVFQVKTMATNGATEKTLYRINDTASHIQNFNTYFAYDDGTAEQGYGPSGSQNGASVALKFNTYMPDSLFGIGIHFNQSISDVSLDFFNLMVWSSINSSNASTGKDDTLARIVDVFPQYVKHTNGFYYFPFAKPVPVGTTFYIGWTQISDYVLNVGFDRNFSLSRTGNDSILFVQQDGLWYKSKQLGVPMIRAFVGKKPVFAGIDNSDILHENFSVELFPNPNQGIFSIKLPEQGKYMVELLDANGKTILSQKNINGLMQLDATQYPSGLYFTHIISLETGSQVFRKVVIN